MKYVCLPILAILLSSCGGGDGSDGNAPGDPNEQVAPDYQREVRSEMKSSKTNSMMKNYGVTQEQAECLLDNLRTSELMRAQTDKTVQQRIEACGVDPAVVK